MWQPQGIYANLLLKSSTIFSGAGAVRGLSNFPGSRFAILYGSGAGSDLLDSIRLVLKDRSLLFLPKKTLGEPTLEEARAYLRSLEEFHPDVIFAIGGGSLMDMAKLCRILYEFPYWTGGSVLAPGLAFKTRFVAMPTLPGSGAEASSAAVYTEGESKNKRFFVHQGLIPDVVLLDPGLLSGLPRQTLALGACDILGHVVESFVSVHAHALTREICAQALSITRSLWDNTAALEEDEGRLRLLYASYLGGVAQNHCLVGITHALAHQIAGDGYSHARAVGLLLPFGIEANRCHGDTDALYARLAVMANFPDFAAFWSFILDITAPLRAQDQGRIWKLLENKTRNFDFFRDLSMDAGGKGNPVPLERGWILESMRRWQEEHLYV